MKTQLLSVEPDTVITEREQVTSRRPPAAAEGAAAGFVLAGILLLHVVTQDGWALFTRPLWLDEVHTLFLAGAAGPSEILGHAAAGAEHNPPTLHLILWAISRMGLDLTPVVLRAFSFVTVCAAASMVYVLLRDSFRVLPSLAGALVVLSHPLVLRHAFDGRMYGLLLLATTLFTHAVYSDAAASPWARRLWLAITAVLLCLTHYFGVVVWLLVLLPAAVRSGLSLAMRRHAAALAGPLTLLACIPMYLGQQASIAGRTWVPDVSATEFAAVVLELIPPPVVIAAATLFFAVGILLGRYAPRTARETINGAGTALAALALMPVILVVVSLLLQPTLVARYAIPTTLAAAPAAAYVVSRMGRELGVGLLAILLLTGHLSVKSKAEDAGDYVRAIEHDRWVLESADCCQPIATISRHFHYRTVLGDSLLTPQVLFVLVPDTEVLASSLPVRMNSSQRATMQVERDVAAIHRVRFGFPSTISLADLRRYDAFVLAGSNSAEVLAFAANWLPDFTLRKLSIRIYQATRIRPDRRAQ